MSIDVGLTGNIASCKSMISGMLREYGAAVLDVDFVGKCVLAENVEGALEQVRSAFGDCIFLETSSTATSSAILSSDTQTS